MPEEHTRACPPDKVDLTPCAVREALQRELVSVEVRDGEEVILSAAQRGHHKYFARVRVGMFDDLQLLGLVPRRLNEQAVRAAITSDDQEALRLAQKMVTRRATTAATCTCEHTDPHPPSFSQDLRAAYRDVRKEHHPALARILSEHYRTNFAWDSTLAGSVRGWVRRVTVREMIVTVALFNDITIGRDATLVLDETSSVLFARAIGIHRTGSLIHKGGFLRIWAASIDSILDLRDTLTKATQHVPWHLDH